MTKMAVLAKKMAKINAHAAHARTTDDERRDVRSAGVAD